MILRLIELQARPGHRMYGHLSLNIIRFAWAGLPEAWVVKGGPHPHPYTSQTALLCAPYTQAPSRAQAVGLLLHEDGTYFQGLILSNLALLVVALYVEPSGLLMNRNIVQSKARRGTGMALGCGAAAGGQPIGGRWLCAFTDREHARMANGEQTLPGQQHRVV